MWRLQMGLRILLADDHLMVRQAIKMALVQAGLQVVEEASNGQEAISKCRDSRPDIAVLDVSMPLINGIDAAREILQVCPATKIVILTMHTQDKYLQESLRLGISGYVVKANTGDELVKAIHAVARGDTYISQFVSPAVPNVNRARTGPLVPLGVRELQVLRLIAEGKSTKEIGHALSVSEKTVRTHRANIMKKLEVQDTAMLVRYSVGRGLLEV
jgi:two-component system response regulator NreC